MRIAFIDHSFHRKTGSSRFLIEILNRAGTVDLIDDHSWDKSTPHDPTPIDPAGYDVVIVFQAHEAFRRLAGPHDNLVFVPMYDAMVWRGQFYWDRGFEAAKVLSFSWALHEEVRRRTPYSLSVQYYPDPGPPPPPPVAGPPDAFFWYRVESIRPERVFDLARGTTFARLTIHNVPDPAQGAGGGWQAPPGVGELALTDWFASPADYLEVLRRHRVFFAPRPLEGIGMSFLEAMAAGLCVAAPDAPTMNEYIAHGTNGLLYPFPFTGSPAPLDFSDAVALGRRARDSVERGRDRWLAAVPNLLDYVATPKRQLARTLIGWRPAREAVSNDGRSAAPAPAGRPIVSVVTVCLNAADALDATLANVLGQTGIAFESVVQDGGSTDGTAEVLKRYASRLGASASGPDGGIYDAMNRAVERCRGDWVLFMNAGDGFVDETALARLFARVPADADVVYGHHLYRGEDGIDRFRPAAGFETTWVRLQRGEIGYDWLARIPAHQATAVRRPLLAALRFDTGYRYAADHDLLFRARRGGARFFHADELVAVYDGTGRSRRAFTDCRREWAAIARSHGDPVGVDRFFTLMAVHHSPALRLASRFAAFSVALAGRIHPGAGVQLAAALTDPRFRGFARCALALAARLTRPVHRA